MMFKQLSNGNSSQITLNPFPIASFGKYIPLVKHTICTIILPNPPVAFSLTKLPINIPIPINKIEISIEINIVKNIFTVKVNPNKHAAMKNNMSCIKIIGINDKIYPKIKSLDFIGDVPSLIKNEEILSFAINVEANNEINEKPNNMMLGVKFSIL